VKDLRDKVAVITGGGGLLGRGMARVFAAEGMDVVVADLDEATARATADEVEGLGRRALVVPTDVTDRSSVEALADRAYGHFGAVHVLCNNAGVASTSAAKAIWDCSLDEWRWVMGVNLMGVVHGIRSFVPKMIAQGSEGHVVNTASMAGLIQGSGIYGVTKHGVVALSESLSNELQVSGAKLKVSVLCPGWVATRIAQAERNRPEAPREDPGPLTPQIEGMRKLFERLIANGLDPNTVGDIVIDAIRNERFYVLTHPTWANMIEHRMRNILEGRDPVGVAPPDAGSWFQELTGEQPK